MKKRKLLIAIILLCVLAISGCTPNPNYYVDTYEKLKNELKDYPDIFFPDISRYDEHENFNYIINHFPTNKKNKHGYSLSFLPWYNTETSYNGSVLSELYVDCTTLEYLAYLTDKTKGSWSVLRPFKPNIEIDGIEIEYERIDSHWRQDETEDEQFPDNTFDGVTRYIFEYRGCQYEVAGTVRLLPDEQVNTDLELIMEEGKEELLDIVMSIITQRGNEE